MLRLPKIEFKILKSHPSSQPHPSIWLLLPQLLHASFFQRYIRGLYLRVRVGVRVRVRVGVRVRVRVRVRDRVSVTHASRSLLGLGLVFSV